MLIRSQNKKSLHSLDSGKSIWVSTNNNEVVIMCQIFGSIGSYSSDAKAIKVLDMIQECYSGMMEHYDYKGDVWATDIPNKVFQMPNDEDVE